MIADCRLQITDSKVERVLLILAALFVAIGFALLTLLHPSSFIPHPSSFIVWTASFTVAHLWLNRCLPG